MGTYILRRLVIMIPTVLIISFISFGIITLPPGDYLESYIASIEAQGERADMEYVEFLRRTYGLDQPFMVQYWRWFSNIITKGDFGHSFEFRRQVGELIGERLALTVLISLVTILITTAIAWPIAIYSATHKYSILDYLFTLGGFVGVSTQSRRVTSGRIAARTASTSVMSTKVNSTPSGAKTVMKIRHVPP